MLKIKQLKGKKNYSETIKKMNKQVLKVSENAEKEEIWFLEHDMVFTSGSSSSKKYDKDRIDNIPLVKVNRGGKITYHGPGQLVIYPIINIKKRKLNIINYINLIEDICIKVFKKYSISLIKKKEKNRGLWVKYNNLEKKIIFIGLRYSKGVIHHGLSINFENNLKYFRKIDPCGLNNKEISSLKEIGIIYNKKKIIKSLKVEFIEKFGPNLI